MSFGKKGLISSDSPSPEHAGEEKPEREARMRRLMKVTVFHERFGRADAVIRDISTGGLGGRCTSDLFPGDVIEIDRPDLGRFEAEVRWVRNGQFGAQLTADLRIDTKVIENLAFNGSNWDRDVIRPLENHVFTRFKPMTNSYRPGFSGGRRDR